VCRGIEHGLRKNKAIGGDTSAFGPRGRGCDALPSVFQRLRLEHLKIPLQREALYGGLMAAFKPARQAGPAASVRRARIS